MNLRIRIFDPWEKCVPRKCPYCFPELPLSMLKGTSIFDNIITSTWCMILNIFCSNFSLHDSLGNAVSSYGIWKKGALKLKI